MVEDLGRKIHARLVSLSSVQERRTADNVQGSLALIKSSEKIWNHYITRIDFIRANAGILMNVDLYKLMVTTFGIVFLILFLWRRWLKKSPVAPAAPEPGHIDQVFMGTPTLTLDGPVPASTPLTPASPTNNRQWMISPKSEATINTAIDTDEFLLRLHSIGMIVNRHKPNNKLKTRCLKINNNCDFALYKYYKRKNNIFVTSGAPYIKLNLEDLKDCFFCDIDIVYRRTFILEFKNKSLQISAETALDTTYLQQGFLALIKRLKMAPEETESISISENKSILSEWKENLHSKSFFGRRSKSVLSPPINIAPADEEPGNDNDDNNDMRSISTITTRATMTVI